MKGIENVIIHINKYITRNNLFFSDVIGQETVKQKLQTVVAKNRISQAYLFSGNTGVGKLALAIAFAQYIMCTNKSNNDSCGTCPSCKKFAKLEHPDLHFVFPVIKKKSSTLVSDNLINEFRENVLQSPYLDINNWWKQIGDDKKVGLIYSEESESIVKKISLKSYESDYKVMIIWCPELMHPTCANKILKTLEEPPEKTVFILVSNDDTKLLETIYSRCQRLNIPNIEEKIIVDKLIKRYAVSEEDAITYSRTSSGSWLRASQQVEESEETEFNFEQFVFLMRTCWARKVLDLISWSRKISGLGRERQKSFLEYAIKMSRESFMSNLKNDSLVFASKREKDFMQRFSPFINEDNLIFIYTELNKAYADIIRNGNAKLIFLDLSLKLVKVIRP